MLYLKLFWSFFQIGLFSFGGGFAAMPFIQNQVVNIHSWLSLTELTDLIAISEMTPGPITINAATFIGTQIAGIKGALVATFACILPSSIIVSLLAWLYAKYKKLVIVQGILGGLRPTIVALILSTGLTIINLSFFNKTVFDLNFDTINFIAIGLFIAAFFVLRKYKINPIFIILACGIAGGALYLIFPG